MKKFLATLLSVAVLLTFAVFAIGSGDDEATVSDGDSAVADEVTEKQKNLTVNAGEVLEAGKLKITYVASGEYKDYSEYLAPKDGYKIIYIDLKAENIGSEDAYISTFEFTCYADDKAMESYYGAGDDISATLSTGRSTSGKVYFEVPVNAENIEIEYETDYWENEKAIFVVK
ncbi:MAG: DUF4352 domain-containing protein [Clostridia bacterium]|nr:DUF4352 domain-containing protein [Clostridia bacterium]